MGLFQSLTQVFVTNSPALLAQGKTVDSLAVGQVAILDGKTNKSVTAPTYANNKAFKLAWGTPNVDLGIMGGVPNENEYSKLIKGKLIRSFRGKKAQKAQTPLWTVGWSGDVEDTDTISGKAGEAKHLFIQLSGTIIERLYSKQGLIKQFISTPPCTDDCSLGCDVQDCSVITDQLVKQINEDKDFKKFVRAKAIKSCSATVTTGSCYAFEVSICDTGDDVALGLAQAQYPNETIVRKSRTGSTSTYRAVKSANVAPADLSNAGVVLIPDCPTCPGGYTSVSSKKVYTIQRTDAGDGTALTAAATAYGIVGPETIARINYEFGSSTYVVASSTVLTAVGADIVSFVGDSRFGCVLTSPTTTAWALAETLENQQREVRITLGDTICGTTRLAELQAAFPTLSVSLVNAAGSCVHTYSATITSECYKPGCAVEDVKLTMPAMFEGNAWTLVPLVTSGTGCKCGIQIESAFFSNVTNECTFDALPYENDVVHVLISNYNPDYNADVCSETDWKVKQIRQVKYPQGHGAFIQRLEKESKSYDLRERSHEPLLREIQGYSFQAQPYKFYDEYVLQFETKWFTSGGWAQEESQVFNLHVFFPEGTGAAFETAINGYLASAAVQVDPVVLN